MEHTLDLAITCFKFNKVFDTALSMDFIFPKYFFEYYIFSYDQDFYGEVILLSPEQQQLLLKPKCEI